MSWEEMSRKRIKCPCGRGTISQASYMDDWNRWEDGPIEVECDFCRENYDVEGEHHNGMLKLKEPETRKYLANAFRDGEIKTVGTDIDKLMPPVSRFGGGGRAQKKQGVIDKLKGFFDKFFGIGGSSFEEGKHD